MTERVSKFEIKSNYFKKWLGIDLSTMQNISYEIKFRCHPNHNIYDIILELGPCRNRNFINQLILHTEFIAIGGIDGAAIFFFNLPLEFREELSKIAKELRE